jgi:hypothetical protein
MTKEQFDVAPLHAQLLRTAESTGGASDMRSGCFYGVDGHLALSAR